MIVRGSQFVVASSLALGACVLPGSDGDDGSGGTEMGSTSGPGTSAADSSTSGGTSGQDESGTSQGGSSGGVDESTGGGTGGPADSCSEATLFIGNPTYDGTDLPDPAGEPIDGVPLHDRHLVFSGDSLVTHVGEEIWSADLSAGAPVWVRRVGEVQEGLPAFALGPCATARLGDTRGHMRTLPESTWTKPYWPEVG